VTDDRPVGVSREEHSRLPTTYQLAADRHELAPIIHEAGRIELTEVMGALLPSKPASHIL